MSAPAVETRIDDSVVMVAILAAHVEAGQAYLEAHVHVPSQAPGSSEPTSDHPAHQRIRRSNALVR